MDQIRVFVDAVEIAELAIDFANRVALPPDANDKLRSFFNRVSESGRLIAEAMPTSSVGDQEYRTFKASVAKLNRAILERKPSGHSERRLTAEQLAGAMTIEESLSELDD